MNCLNLLEAVDCSNYSNLTSSVKIPAPFGDINCTQIATNYENSEVMVGNFLRHFNKTPGPSKQAVHSL